MHLALAANASSCIFPLDVLASAFRIDKCIMLKLIP